MHHESIIFILFVVSCLVMLKSFPMIIRHRSSANACKSCVSVNIFSSSSSTRFHKNGDRTPPWGAPFDNFLDIIVPAISRVIVTNNAQIIPYQRIIEGGEVGSNNFAPIYCVYSENVFASIPYQYRFLTSTLFTICTNTYIKAFLKAILIKNI